MKRNACQEIMCCEGNELRTYQCQERTTTQWGFEQRSTITRKFARNGWTRLDMRQKQRLTVAGGYRVATAHGQAQQGLRQYLATRHAWRLADRYGQSLQTCGVNATRQSRLPGYCPGRS